jgi:putative PIN family toxin of toxin-antitoxin system
MRFTLDSNILVRANNRATGPAREILRFVHTDLEHRIVLSRHILDEVARVLAYPRLQLRYQLKPEEIQLYVAYLEEICTLVHPVVVEPVILTDPDDDPVLYTALDGNAEVLCTLNRDFHSPNVLAFCAKNGILLMNDVELLLALRKCL